MTEPRIIPDDKFPAMFRIHWPDGAISGMANITRCREAVRQFDEPATYRPYDPPQKSPAPTDRPSITLTIHSDDGGITWEAWVGDDPLGRFRDPLTDGARVLLKDGADPKTKLELKHRGQDFVSLTSSVGFAASKRIVESSRDGLVFVPFEDTDQIAERMGRSPGRSNPP